MKKTEKQLSEAAISAAAAAMLVVLANVDAGLRSRFNSAWRVVRRRSIGVVDFMAKRANVGYGVAVDRGEDR